MEAAKAVLRQQGVENANNLLDGEDDDDILF